MKILQVHNDYLLTGGETTSVNKITALLRENGNTVVQYWKNNEDLVNPSLGRKLRFIREIVFNPRTCTDIVRLGQDADVLHAHNLYPVISLAAYHGAKKAGIPIIQHLQNYRLFCANGVMVSQGRINTSCIAGRYGCAILHACQKQSRIIGLVYAAQFWYHRIRKTYELVDYFIAPSSSVKKVFEQFGIPQSKITVLNHFIDASLYQHGKEDRGYYVYVGRLSHEKGVRTLVKAFLDRPGLTVHIAGTGPDETLLRSMALGQEHRIIFHGHKQRDEIASLIAHARALVVPSECFETFGLSALESLASGVPVLAVDIGGVTDIVQEGKTGKLFQSGLPSALVESLDFMERMSAEARQAMRRAARDDAESRFGKKKYYEQLMSVYEHVLAKHP